MKEKNKGNKPVKKEMKEKKKKKEITWGDIQKARKVLGRCIRWAKGEEKIL